MHQEIHSWLILINFDSDARLCVERSFPNAFSFIFEWFCTSKDTPFLVVLYDTFAFCHMPFWLCYALETFQRCMTMIFFNFLERSVEIFIDDFWIFKDSFEICCHSETHLKYGWKIKKLWQYVNNKLIWCWTRKSVTSWWLRGLCYW